MPLVDSLIAVTVTLATRTPTQANFGTPLLFGYHTAWPVARTKAYTDADDMLADGFTSSDQLYKDAQIVCAQNPRPSQFKVGRRVTPLTQTIVITPTITTQGFVYTGTIAGKALSYTVPGSATIASICTGLAAAITALSAGVTPSASATNVTLTSPAGVTRAMSFDPGLDILDSTPDTTTDTELAALAAIDGDWYGLIVSDSQSKATALLQASWTETQKRATLIQSADSNCLDGAATTDTMSALKALTYANSPCVYHRAIGGSERLNAGWLARILVPDPGAATPAWKAITGVTPDVLNTTQMNAVLAKNGSFYVTELGLNITFEGKTPSGSFIDTTRGFHWLAARIQSALVQLFASADIVPFTDSGREMVLTAIRGVVDLAVSNGFLSGDTPPVVSAPSVASVASADRLNRRLPNITITGNLSGAIHGLKNPVKVTVIA